MKHSFCFSKKISPLFEYCCIAAKQSAKGVSLSAMAVVRAAKFLFSSDSTVEASYTLLKSRHPVAIKLFNKHNLFSTSIIKIIVSPAKVVKKVISKLALMY